MKKKLEAEHAVTGPKEQLASAKFRPGKFEDNEGHLKSFT